MSQDLYLGDIDHYQSSSGMQSTFQPYEGKSAGVKLLAGRQLSFSTFKDIVLSSAIGLVHQAVESKPIVLTIACDVWGHFVVPFDQ